ncbi:MAG: hypothetical protein AAF773_25795, partial [Cyanobacteria bacterium P01_D01_bin.115]
MVSSRKRIHHYSNLLPSSSVEHRPGAKLQSPRPWSATQVLSSHSPVMIIDPHYPHIVLAFPY